MKLEQLNVIVDLMELDYYETGNRPVFEISLAYGSYSQLLKSIDEELNRLGAVQYVIKEPVAFTGISKVTIRGYDIHIKLLK